jgi:Mg/Co/Ni transporter MgtE
MRADVPRSRPGDRLADICGFVDETGWETSFVVDEKGVVLGRVGRRAIREREDVSAEEAMTLGPSTIRPSARLRYAAERMQREGLTSLPVTTSEGRLVGLLLLADAERALDALGAP